MPDENLLIGKTAADMTPLVGSIPSTYYVMLAKDDNSEWVRLSYTEFIAQVNDILGDIATPSSTSGTPTKPEIRFVSGAGTYTNFLSAASTPIVVNASDGVTFVQFNPNTGFWTKHASPQDLTNYPTKASLYPAYVKNKATLYTSNEVQIINAIKNISITVPSGTENDNWVIQYVTNIPTVQSSATYAYTIQIYNSTANKYYKLTYEGTGFVVPKGHTFYNNITVQDSVNSGTFVTFSAEVDWNVLSTNFENSTLNIVIVPGILDAGANALLQVKANAASIAAVNQNLYPLWVKNKTTAYSTNEALVIKAIRSLSIFNLPAGTDANQWIIAVVGTVPPTLNGAAYGYTIQVKNTVTNKYYNICNEGSSFVVPTGVSIYKGTASDTANTSTTIDFYAEVDWNALPGSFEINTLNIVLRAGKLEASADLNPRLTAVETAQSSLQAPNPIWIKNQSTIYTGNSLSLVKAIKQFSITVPVGTESNNWIIQYAARNPTVQDAPTFGHTIQIQNVTTGKYYMPVHQGASFTPPVGLSYYKTRVQDTANSGTYIDAYVEIDWNALASNFESFFTIAFRTGVVSAAADLYKEIQANNTGIKYPTSALVDETIWVGGTSIPAGGGYHELAAAQNGATLINKAQGSSMVRSTKADGTITGIPWTCYGYALSHTVAEKQYIIDNWATVRLDLASSPPTTLDQPTKDLFLSCSYENRLLPYLNGTLPMPKVFVFDHGFNDASPFTNGTVMVTANGNVTMTETEANFIAIPSTRNNKGTFIGAMNFLLDLIFQYNPKAKVFFVSHYESWELPRVVKSQQVLADYWGLPILRLDQKLGWSNQIAVGSNALWATAPYSSYTAGWNTANDITIKHVWLPDNLHIGSDTTGKATEHVGNKVGSFYFQES